MSGNKMLDTINKERFTVIAQKYCKLTARNMGTFGPDSVGGVLPSGTNLQSDLEGNEAVLSHATKIVKSARP